jgi:hypothetical protein
MKQFLETLGKYVATIGGRRRQANTVTRFKYDSSRKSYVAEGRRGLMYEFDRGGWIIAPTVTQQGRVICFVLQKLDSSENWHIDFAAPLGQKLRKGVYDGATRHSFKGSNAPGLDFYGCGRSNSKLAGKFEILEISVLGGSILSFAADFIQFDGCIRAKWNRGSIRYNSLVEDVEGFDFVFEPPEDDADSAPISQP